MKKLTINALCLLVVAVGGSRLQAQAQSQTAIADETNYQTCMRYCMAEHGFDYCQAQCKDLAEAN